MKITDGRNLGQEAQQQLRYFVIKLLKEGTSRLKIIEITGVSLSAIVKWWKIYKTKGLDGLILKKRGVKSGTNCKLDSTQTQKLKQILIDTTPDQFNLPFSLWTRQAIQNVVFKFWSIYMPLRTISDYMKRLGFTPQKPVRSAYEQNPKVVRKWLDEIYPKIAKKAKKYKAEIHWIDETGLNSNSNYVRGYSIIGNTPIVRMKAKRFSINLISSITNQGKMRFMTYAESMNSKKLIIFINRLFKDIKRKIFVILDNLAVHHSKVFKAWLEKKKDKIEVFYLPSYSPELNPDERLNRDLKTHFHSGSIAKTKMDFIKKAISFLKTIQRMPFRIKNYFNSKAVRYAALSTI